MAVYDLEEQEQLDELKTWWKQYGNLVTGGVLAVAVGMAGWQGWNLWQRNQSAQAAAIYGVLERAAATHDAKKARDATGELTDKFSMTSYAGMAALLSAKMQVEAGDLKTAKLQLGWALENARDRELRDLARLRLAGVLLDEKAYDEALKQLASEPAAPFAARYAELRGDILAAQGKTDEAKIAYQAALTKVDEAQKIAAADQHRGPYRELLQLKLESIGGKKP
jgi:predicted negative regulator of RcsB-dependent stress response